MGPSTSTAAGQIESEKPVYNPPATVRQNHNPLALISGIFTHMSSLLRPEHRPNFQVWDGGSGRSDKPGHYRKSIMKRRRLRDIAKASRRRNRAA